MSPLKYRPEIDGLRAVAVAAVVLYHADPALLPGGFVGVDVFFVISGYLITVLLVDEQARTGRIDFPSFYARRARRLLPALIVLVAAVMAMTTVLLGRYGDVFQQTGASAVASLLFVANFYFQLNSGGYFYGPVEGMPLLHLWSLSVEEQYYLVYPLLLAALLRWFPGDVFRRIALLAVMSLLLAEYWVHIHPERAFYQMPSRFWELATGAMVALSSVPAVVKPRDRWLLPIGVLLVLGASLLTPGNGHFPGIVALPPVLGGALVLLALHRGAARGPMADLLGSRAMVTLGLISYSLYLWHWPLLAIDRHLSFDSSPRSTRLLLCAAALLFAWLSWRFVERPFRRGGRSSRAVLALAALSTAICLLLVLGLARLDQVPPDARRLAERASSDRPMVMNSCHLSESDLAQRILEPACRSVPGKSPTYLFWGDSHAAMWQPFAYRIAAARGESTAGATMNACPPGAGLGATPAHENCARLNRLMARALRTSGVDTVIVSQRWPISARPGDPPLRGYSGRMADLDAALSAAGAARRVLIIGPLPILRHDAPSCISSGREEECAMGRKHLVEQTEQIWRGLRRLALRHPNSRLIDATDFFCDADVCPVVRDGYSLYWDDDHISATAARTFAERYLAEPERYTVDVTPPAAPEHR